MELNQLRAFIAIAREGNLTRASRTLFLSQPAVSAQLKALEEALVLKLFNRTPKGMVLTKGGELLLNDANLALAATENLMSRARNYSGQVVGKLRIGTISDPVSLKLGKFMSMFLASYPEAKIHLSHYVSGEIVERIIADQLDAGYVIGDVSMPGLSVIKLRPITFHIAGPVKWKEKLENSSWQDLSMFPWIGTSPKCSFNKIAKKVFSEHDIDPTEIVETDQEVVLQNLISDAIGLGFLRQDHALAAVNAGDVYIWPGGSVRSYLQLVYKSENGETPLLKALIAQMKELWVTK